MAHRVWQGGGEIMKQKNQNEVNQDKNTKTRGKAADDQFQGIGGKWLSAEAETAEHWWTKASHSKKVLALQIASMMCELTDTKRIEIRLEERTIRVRFIHLLKEPEPGCLTAVMLPERASGGRN
jgi:hypothetical protein